MQQLFSLFVFLFFCQFTKAQEFATPTETPTGKVLVTTVDGKTAYGKFTSFTWEARGLGNFRIKDSASGETIKFEPENVKTFKFISKPMFGFMRKKEMKQLKMSISLLIKYLILKKRINFCY